MKKRPYLDDVRVSRLGFGAWPLGNTAHGKTMTEEEGVALVREAIKKGINFFDTAPNYAGGRSETILGRAVEGIRDKVVINTKFGHHPDGRIDFGEERIMPSLEGSMKRLRTDYLDSVILHNPGMDVLRGETGHFAILDSLRAQGIIKGYGASIDTKEEIEAVLAQDGVGIIELLYNVFFQATRPLLEKIKERGVALIIKVPLDSGWLTGKYDKDSTFTDIRSRWTKEDKQRRHDLVERLKALVGDDDLTPHAMGFLWSYDAITTVIPGIRNREQLEKHIAATEADFPVERKKAFEDFYDKHIAKNPLPW